MVAKKHKYIWILPQARLDEAQEVFLVHAGRVMDMCINLSNIVEIPVRYFLNIVEVNSLECYPFLQVERTHLCIRQLLILVEEDIHVKL